MNPTSPKSRMCSHVFRRLKRNFSAKKARIESSENSILSESNHNNSVSPFQALYNLNCVDHDPKTVAGIVSNIRDQYAQAIRVVNEKVAPTVDSTATAPGELSQTTTSLATLMK